MTALAPEGAIRVRLLLAKARIDAVEILPRPAPPLNVLLAGKSAAELRGMIPRLFSLCPQAQAQAAASACNAALGIAPSLARSAAQKILSLAEIVSEQARHLSLEAPLAFGLAPDVETAKASRREAAHLAKPLSGTVIKPAIAELAESLDRLRLLLLNGPMGGEDVAAFVALGDFENWARRGRSPLANVFQKILNEGLAGFGASDVGLMTGLDASFVAARMEAADWADFAKAPRNAAGQVLETGPLARQYEHPLLKAMKTTHGNGLAARLLARLIESRQALAAMSMAIPLLGEDAILDPDGGVGQGLGVAEAARGRLFHWLRLEKGRVVDYRLLAPTEWNFHPQGPFVKGLSGIAVKDPEGAVKLARIQGLALDPCVGLEIEVA